MSPKPTTVFDGDNPEWTSQDFARALRDKENPAHILAAFPKTRGRPAGSNKQLVSLRIDRDVIEQFRSGGPGWQSRINEALRKAVRA